MGFNEAASLHPTMSCLTSTQNDVISKLCTCAVSLAIYLSLCQLLPVEHSIDDGFVSGTPFHLQVVYLYLAMLALRPKYYFVWTLGEFDVTLSLEYTFLSILNPRYISFIFSNVIADESN